MWAGKRPIDDYNFYSLLGVVQTGMWLQRDIEAYLKPFGLSFGRFSILLSILDSPGKKLRGSDLARKNGISRTTVSKMVGRLLEDGLIAALPSEEDQRVVEFGLAKAGMDSLRKIVPGYLERMRIIGAGISLPEKRALIDILGKLAFLDGGPAAGGFAERPISEKANEIMLLCRSGAPGDIDRVMDFLDETSDIPTTRIVDYYLGTVGTVEGMRRIEHYLFNGTQMQRNYATLFFARRNDWKLVDKAYRMGLIDYVQAYSK
jgi:DNA-binding MarR family transcriptional regulator